MGRIATLLQLATRRRGLALSLGVALCVAAVVVAACVDRTPRTLHVSDLASGSVSPGTRVRVTGVMQSFPTRTDLGAVFDLADAPNAARIKVFYQGPFPSLPGQASTTPTSDGWVESLLTVQGTWDGSELMADDLHVTQAGPF